MPANTPPPLPLTSDEAEKLAVKLVGEYLTACHIASTNDREAMGNYLMKLCSVAGATMAAAEGSETAFDRLLGTAQFVLKSMPKRPARMMLLQ